MTSVARIATLLALAAGVAHAQTPPQNKTEADAAYADGQKAYANKDYKTAASRFMIAFNNDPDPIYLFNAAQAYRLDGNCADAYDTYKRFYAFVKDKQVSGIEKVQEYIDEEAKCSHDATLPPKQPEQIPVSTQQPQQPAQPQQPTEPAQPLPRIDRGGESTPSKLPSIALIAGGGALVVLGVVGTLQVGSIHDDAVAAKQACANAQDSVCKPLANENSRGHTWQDIEIASYALGGVAVIAGVGLLYLQHGRSTEHMVMATPAPGGAQVTALWRF